jgi:predicted metalloprotease with PDZ domain
MPHPASHCFEVEILVNQAADFQDYIDFKLPVWTPGSYLVREYAKNVQGFRAYTNDNRLPHTKTNKNTWRVFLDKSYPQISVFYNVYAYELTVRTSFLDESHAYLNGASVFMCVESLQKQPATLHLVPYYQWKNISTALKPLYGNPVLLYIPDYDTLVDSPIEIGNHQTITFTAQNIPHHFALVGIDGYDAIKLIADTTKIIDSATAIFGEHPCSEYTFLATFSQAGRGGLEHKDSTSLLSPRESLYTAEGYEDFLSLIAHEYFHLWNVKRLRPAPLGPFDYASENYTTMLWMAEGFTSYYEKLILLKAGIITAEKFLAENLENINQIENQVGNQVLSVAEASWDAWIKAYRPNENSTNATISYYTKGAVLALLLDWEIIQNTQGRQNLDDFMRMMYQHYYKNLNRGFTEQELKAGLEEIARMSLTDFFEKYVYGTHTIDYVSIFKKMGFTFRNKNEKHKKANLGLTLDKNTVKTVQAHAYSSAYRAGLNVGDEIIGINGQSVSDIPAWADRQKIGSVAVFHIKRDGLLRTIKVKFLRDQSVKYSSEPLSKVTPAQIVNYQKWLRNN